MNDESRIETIFSNEAPNTLGPSSQSVAYGLLVLASGQIALDLFIREPTTL